MGVALYEGVGTLAYCAALFVLAFWLPETARGAKLKAGLKPLPFEGFEFAF